MITDFITKNSISKHYVSCLLYVTNIWPIELNNTKFVVYIKELLHSHQWENIKNFGSLPDDFLNLIHSEFNINTEI